jgi:putative membrane protein
MNLLIRFLVNAIALYLIARYVPGFTQMSVLTALIAAIVFGIVNAIIGPILRFVTFPITWLTHGLFAIVVNYILFWLTVFFTPNFSATGTAGLPKWEVLLIGAVIMMIVSTVVQQLSKSDAERAAESTS